MVVLKNLTFSIIFCISLPMLMDAQILFDPQMKYDASGGLFEKDSLRSIHINFENDNFFDILSESFFSDPSYRLPATVALGGFAYDSVGVRFKGNSTFCLPYNAGNAKVPYNIDMNYWVSGQKLLEYKKIKLANAWLDPTFAKEFSSAKIYRNYLPTPEVNLMKLFVQDEYVGMYVNTEAVNKQFCMKHFDEKDGALFKCDPAQVFCGNDSTSGYPGLVWLGGDSSLYYNSYIRKSDAGWQEMMDLIYAINFDFDNIDNLLNVDRVLWAFAVNTAILNQDTYNGTYVHNYYMYQTEDGRFQMIPWDLSESFIGALLGWSFNDPSQFYEHDPYFGPMDRPLANQIMEHPMYRKQYTAHIRTILDEWNDLSDFTSMIEELQILAYDDVALDTNKLFSMDQFVDNVNNNIWNWGSFWGYGGILEPLEARFDFLNNHPEISQTPPEIGAVLSNEGVITVETSNVTTVELMHTLSPFNAGFEAATMHDSGMDGDAIAGDGIYSITVPPVGVTDTLRFYIRAQNEEAMRLSPQRAEYEFYFYDPANQLQEYTMAVEKSLVRITDLLGRTTEYKPNTMLLYLYDDGSTEKRMVLE